MFKDMMNVYNLVNKYTGMIATYTFDDIVGKSEKFIKVMRQAKKYLIVLLQFLFKGKAERVKNSLLIQYIIIAIEK